MRELWDQLALALQAAFTLVWWMLWLIIPAALLIGLLRLFL